MRTKLDIHYVGTFLSREDGCDPIKLLNPVHVIVLFMQLYCSRYCTVNAVVLFMSIVVFMLLYCSCYCTAHVYCTVHDIVLLMPLYCSCYCTVHAIMT
jgi:hypothetical protein